MKLALRILMILVLPFLIIGGTNFIIDPDYSLRKDYIPSLAESLSKGNMLSGPVNINSRLLKKQWIENLPYCPQVLILGSSRTLSLSQKMFPGKTFFNASVTNSTFQDMLAFLNCIEKKKKGLPQTVIICVDQWLFGDTFKEDRWQLNREDAIQMANKINGIPMEQFPPKWDFEKKWLKELFSVRYFFRSVTYRKRIEKFQIRETIDKNAMIFLPDGSRILPINATNIGEDELHNRVRNYYLSSKDEQFSEIIPQKRQLFESIISYLRANACQIVLYLPPFQPEMIKWLKQSNKTSGVFKVNDFIFDFAEAQNLQLIGNTDPYVINLAPTDFYDAVHLKPEALTQVIESGLR